jgi:PEGA domain
MRLMSASFRRVSLAAPRNSGSAALGGLASLFALGLALAFGAVATTAAGQPASARAVEGTEDARRTEAERRFQQGLVLARQQSWDAALAEFLASRELYPTRSATRNAAVALQNLGRFSECYEMYEALLREFGDAIAPDQRRTLQAEMAVAAMHVGELLLRVDPDALVTVDEGRRGTGPLDPIRVNAGTHVVRVEKPGFETEQRTVSVAGGARKLVHVTLRKLTDLGALVVREVSGASLPVLLDGVQVGSTPWSGNVSPGSHAVQLAGANALGTAPSSASVGGGLTTTLVLRAVSLSAHLRVEPIPSSANVYIDGVDVGAGIWDGRLPPGWHRIEAAAPGHWTYGQKLRLSAERRYQVTAALERDASSPLWRSASPRELYVEATVAAPLAASFHGDADDSCHCDSRHRPLGVLAGARFGYGIAPRLSLELSAGYLRAWEWMTRTVNADVGGESWQSVDYRDVTRLFGPWLTLGVAYRSRSRSKLVLVSRAALGLAALTTETAGAGRFTSVAGATTRVGIAEDSLQLVTFLASTELSLGYKVTPKLSAGVGLGLTLFLPPSRLRSAVDDTFGGPSQRAVALPAGTVRLPEERVAGAFLALIPGVSARYMF